MRIIIDELPEHPSDCMFAKYSCSNGTYSVGSWLCGVPNPIWIPCTIESECPYLVSCKEFGIDMVEKE